MIRLLRSDLERFVLRRISRFFPLVLLALILGGVVIAYFVITNGDGDGPDFVSDLADGQRAIGILGPLGSLLPVMAFVLGASFIGADLKAGVIEQVLTWEPRRVRVLASRLVAAFLGVGVLSMLLATATIGFFYGLCAAAGTTDGVTTELWLNAAVVVVRTGLAEGLFAAFGLSVTAAVASSLAAIVGFIIYWFIIEGFLLQAFLPKVAVYLPVTNADSFSSSRDVRRIDGSVFSSDGFDTVVHHDYIVAGLILAGWVAVAIVIGTLVFRWRDVD